MGKVSGIAIRPSEMGLGGPSTALFRRRLGWRLLLALFGQINRTGNDFLSALNMLLDEPMGSTNVIDLILRQRTFFDVVRNIPDYVQSLNPCHLVRLSSAGPILRKAVIVLKFFPVVLKLDYFRVI
jgi:hypothetical protein